MVSLGLTFLAFLSLSNSNLIQHLVSYLTISLTLTWIVCVLIQVYYWYAIYGKLFHHQKLSTRSEPQAVSIIVCAHNAYNKLSHNMHYLLDQDYSEYEIILMDDHSTDGTFEKSKRIDNEKRILSVYKVNQNALGKKQALAEGIDHARHKWVLLTDADCRPASKNWISTLMASTSSCVKEKTKIILGYSPYESNGTIVGYWSHFEAWITAVQYLSHALAGHPYMGVGRNLLYRKELVSSSLLTRYGHLASGDDDLTLMQIATAENTTICLHPDSHVHTTPESTWSAYYRQKQRHFSASNYYKSSTKLRLSLYSSSQVLCYLLLIALAICGYPLLALACQSLRMLILLPKVHSLKQTLEARFKLSHFLILDLCQAIFYLIFSFAVLFPKKQTW